jgi:UDP-2-acetamido-2,6-beta-L-arabino-hexul-4-ose reductase
MKILVTGSQGFIGKNLNSRLEIYPKVHLFQVDRSTPENELIQALEKSDLIIHLAGESRSRQQGDSFSNNLRYTEFITGHSKKTTPVIFASTNKKNHLAYWQVKQEEEKLLSSHFVNLKILRMDNVFGKWAKPFYNSVVATFIHSTIHHQPFQLFQEHELIPFLYIDELIELIIGKLNIIQGHSIDEIKGNDKISAKEVLSMIQTIHQDYEASKQLSYQDDFQNKLALTYLSYLPESLMVQPSASHPDSRGNFIELTKGNIDGQTSINVIQGNQVKGNHYHHIRWEKFLILSGDGHIRLRKKFTKDVIVFSSKEHRYQFVTIPPGYIHEIVNTGKSEMIVWMWSSLVYDSKSPDTYQENV